MREGASRGTGTSIRRRNQNGPCRRGEERVEYGGRGQPPVLILIENASAEKVARARARARVRVYVLLYTHTDTDATTPRQPEAARERQRPGKRPWGAVVRGGNSI